MNFLTLENVNKTYGEKVLFSDLNLQINKGERIALVAKNGSGKSTLLRVISGTEAPEGETAKVLFKKDIKVGFLPQEPEFYEGHTILEAVLDSDNPMTQAVKDYEEAMLFPERTDDMEKALAQMDDLKAWDFEAQIKETLSKLNISNFNQTVRTLSGGQKKRLALAKIIIDEPEFLIMDEPTNHLDIDMIEWLEQYLQQPSITLFMVTHDRYFLDRVCNTIYELDRGEIFKYSGNYSDYLTKKAARVENEAVVYEKAKKLYKKELDWINRTPQARTTKSKSRIDKFQDLKGELSNKQTEGDIQIDIKGQRLGKKILELHNVQKKYGDKVMLDGFSYKFRKKERVGIVGPNGVGKTTFLHILTEKVRVDNGKVVKGDNTVFGYYTQDGINLKEDKRVIEVITDIAEYIPLEKGQKLTAASLLERFLFSRKQQQVYVSQLSGGERRRLFLLSILMRNPNFLILDEPTNDLDIMTLNVLEDFLMDFPGCVLIVSHDRYFMNKIVEHLFVFEGNGIIKDFNGDYSDYREYIKEKEQEKRREERESQNKQKQQPNTQKNNTSSLSYEQRKEMNKLEKEISRLEEKKREITDKFNDTSITPEDIDKYSKELSAVKETIEEKELRWMELAEMA